jgi:aminoglycoside phosphotransferase (APT) family kinase protein
LLPEAVIRFLRESGLARSDEIPAAAALAGGVSSDIWRVELARGPVCVKRALPRLRVAQLWEAPVERNRYEYEWFRVAGDAAPQSVPRMLARADGVFAMEYLEPSLYPVWKELLRDARVDEAFAALVGRSLAAIHSASAGRKEVEKLFRTDDIFYAIRLEPYLVAAGRKHPDLSARLRALVKTTEHTKLALVHGDISPKNILAGPQGPIFLDAECAWYGDPAFDLAFCLNHLLLKCLWKPQAAEGYLDAFGALKNGYLSGVNWETPSALELRTATLLPGLMLARVDGKSPVEYLTSEPQRDAVRRAACPLIADPPQKLFSVLDAWRRSLP